MSTAASEAEGLELSRFGTSFVDPATETRYRTFQLDRSAPFHQVGVASAVVLWIVFGALLLATGVIHVDAWAAWIFGLLVPANAFGAYVAHRADWRRWMPAFIAGLNTLAGTTGVVFVVRRLGLIDASSP